MPVRKILTREQPVLRRKAHKVSRFDASLDRLVQDMWETMRDAPGVGLAAPQIGVPLRVLVAEHEDNRVAFVNPEIVKRAEDELLGAEGCLSIPGYIGENIRRAAWVTVKGRDPKGKEIRVHAEGWFARILQHEIDHLDGILFTDRLDRPEDLREVTEEEVLQEAEGQPAPGARARPAPRKEGGADASGARSAASGAPSAPSDRPAGASGGRPDASAGARLAATDAPPASGPGRTAGTAGARPTPPDAHPTPRREASTQ